MKKLIFLLFLIPVFASAQKTTGTNYTYIAQRYEWLAGVFKALGLPAGDSPTFQTGQEQRAGAVYYDSTGGDAGLYIWDGVAWVLQGGSVTPTFQQVLTAGSILTGNNTVNGGGFNFYLSNHRLFNINSVSVTGDTAATFEFNPDIGQSIISMSDLTNTTSFTFRPESSAILSPLISLTTDNLYFNGSLPSAAITDSVLTWDAVSKQVRLVARADIGGGGSQDLNDVALIGNVSTVGLRSNTAIEVLDTITGAGAAMDKLGYISVTNTSIKAGRISATLLTDDRYFELPDTSGTFALLSDIVGGGGDAFLANNQTFTGENTFSNATNKFTGLPITDTTEGYVAIKADGTLVKAMKVVVDTNAFFAPNQTSGGNTSHDGNNFDFLFTNAKDINFIANENFNIDALSFLGLTATTQINAISPDITWQANNVLALIAADSFNISTPTGVITIDTLQQSTDTTAFKPTAWNTATQSFKVLDHWPGGGGGNLLFDSLGTAGISPVTTRNDTLYSRRISVSGGSIDTTASGGLLITVAAGGVTDHGALTGLADDDHTQYALLAGRSGGQTLNGGTASGNSLTLASTTDVTKGSIFIGSTSAYDEVNNRLGIGTVAPSTKLHILAGTLAVGGSAIRTLVTMPSNVGALNGEDFNITGSGSTSTTLIGRSTVFQPGFTGAGTNAASVFLNQSAGTGTGSAVTSGNISYRPVGVTGTQLRAEATTTGNTVGGVFLAGGGNVSIGGWAAATGTKNSATNVGLAAFGRNAGTTPIQVGGYFALADYGASLPTFASAALIADNAAQTDPIFLARDNGTTVFSIVDGGGVNVNSTVTAGGVTGAQTINKASGTVNFAAAATTLVVTNSLVTTSSIVFAVVRTNDGTALIKNVVPVAGSFTITLNAAATAETSVGFFVIN